MIGKSTSSSARLLFFLSLFLLSLSLSAALASEHPAGPPEPWSETVFEYVNETYGAEAEDRLRYLHDLVDDNQHLSVGAKLKLVNETLNHLPWIADAEHWQEADYWATPMQTITTFGGDCEDYAIAKWLVLEHLGISPTHLRLAYVKIKATGEDHMVLLYIINPTDPPQQQKAYVLDNYIDQVKSDDERDDLLAIFVFDVHGNVVLIEDNGTELHVKGVYEERRIKKLEDLLRRIDEEDAIYSKLNGGRSLLPSV